MTSTLSSHRPIDRNRPSAIDSRQAMHRPRPKPDEDRRLPRQRRPTQNLDVVRDMIDTARAEQAGLSPLSPDRAYYLGVETAAQQVLHRDVEATDQVHWLDRVHPCFIAGYVETAAALAPFWSWSEIDPVPPTTGRRP
jgi:hypothetical protein